MNAFRAIYRFWVSLVTLAVVVQIAFAGYGAFDVADKVDDGGSVDEDSFVDSFGPHMGLGYLILLGSLILLLVSFGARGRQRILRSTAVFVLLIVQVLLAWTGGAVPYISGALHPINAFVILGLLGTITYREWRVERMAPREAALAAPPA
jgi:amino acid transporter